ncbi:uncharacterized protein NMK_2300 [Novimethylophilus kurashikiensis]|uniref:PIN-like domain-containing protein n=1 Tax=Novimethylophilus kurashikiensis TaxID=1825523 RepID=A0A2R5FA50_9PROT|nr:PIN domain-containing protein [Novimethylophilus kurashikiensis]GBG14699.1 uncharacterized protein NMK_2300 [Novimethylophilus kurashikiensis]
MQTHYVFVDYENTQLGNIGLIGGCKDQPKVKIFLNRHQSMIPLTMARALHAMGDDAEYIQIDSGRRNVIEFNIAFQLGELATQFPESRFTIVSNDTGFDEIVAGLRQKGIACARIPDIEGLLERSAENAYSAPLSDEKVIPISDTLKSTPPKSNAHH